MKFKPLLNIIGALLSILGTSMIVPIFISIGYGESDTSGFIISSLLCIGIGLPLWLFTRYSRTLTNRDGFAIVTFSWIVTAIIGAMPFYFSGSIPDITDAFFESVSGLTTTGSTIINDIENSSRGIILWRAILQWLGGIGIIVSAISILPS